jgi:hypothetical protein
MDAITVSAKFAAFNWFTEISCGKYNSQNAAARFAEENWEHFLAHANKGLGRLLVRLSKRSRARNKRGHVEVA